MSNLKKILASKLKEARKIAILGVGSELRSDDSCGIVIADALKKSRIKISQHRRLKVFIGATAPENLTGEIKKFQPTHLIIVDSAQLKKKAGTAQLIEVAKSEGISFCTHNLPIKVLTDYLVKSINCEIIIIGIQPKRLDFGSKLSPEVAKSAKQVSDMIQKALPG